MAMKKLILTTMAVAVAAMSMGQILVYYDDIVDKYSGPYTEYYNDDVVKAEYQLIDGTVDGTVTYYYENGQIQEVRGYNMGVKTVFGLDLARMVFNLGKWSTTTA